MSLPRISSLAIENNGSIGSTLLSKHYQMLNKHYQMFFTIDRVAYFVGSVLLIAAPVAGQEAQHTSTSQGLTLTIDPIKTPRFVTEPVELHVVVSSDSNDATDLRELRVAVPEEIRASETPPPRNDGAWREGFVQAKRPDSVPDNLVDNDYEYVF